MTDSPKTSTATRYPLNQDAVKRALMLGGSPIVFGVFGWVFVLMQIANGEPFSLLVSALSACLLLGGGYILFHLWPRFLFADVCDERVYVKYKGIEFVLPWSEIRRVEHFAGDPKEQTATLFVETGSGEGHLFDATTVDRFDEFASQFRQYADKHSIELQSLDDTR